MKKTTVISEYLINHPRFTKVFEEKDLDKFEPDKLLLNEFPHTNRKYFKFFNGYAKNNYTQKPIKCLCGKHKDTFVSSTDKCGVEFHVVICNECGLIRAKNYFTNKDVENFYANHYRLITDDKKDFIEPENLFNDQKNSGLKRKKIIEKIMSKKFFLKNNTIVDIGGGCGGVLDVFPNNYKKYLADYYDPYLKFAKSKNIHVIKGGLKEINFKPDIIILSHVMEHWADFENEINDLINLQIPNHTINYIEFPGIDSLKNYRRGGDLLGDIQIAHVYYFASYVFENIMNRYGFEKKYIDSEIKSVFIYTGKVQKLINYFTKVKDDLVAAEKTRNIQILKNVIKLFIPKICLKLIRKSLGKIN